MKKTSDEPELIVQLDYSYNPYTDDTLKEVQPEKPMVDHNEPFNDAVKHGDIVVGHQRNRILSDYPKQVRPLVRINAVVTLLTLAVALVWGIIQLF